MNRPLPAHAHRYFDSLQPESDTFARVERFVDWAFREPLMPLPVIFIVALVMFAALRLWAAIERTDAAARRAWLGFIDWADRVEYRRVDRAIGRATQIFATFAIVVSIAVILAALIVMRPWEVR